MLLITIFNILFCFAKSQDLKITTSQNERDREGRLNHGSILNSPIIFGDTKNNSNNQNTSYDKKICKFNPTIWNAAIAILKGIPLASVDYVSGIIITDWYMPNEYNKVRFKVMIQITGRTLSPNSIEVVVYKQVKKKTEWISEDNKEEIQKKIHELSSSIISEAKAINIAQSNLTY